MVGSKALPNYGGLFDDGIFIFNVVMPAILLTWYYMASIYYILALVLTQSYRLVLFQNQECIEGSKRALQIHKCHKYVTGQFLTRYIVSTWFYQQEIMYVSIGKEFELTTRSSI